MMGMLASLGIEKGKPLNPDEKTKKAMHQAAIDAYHYMHERVLHSTDKTRIWWEDRHWSNGLFADKNHEFSYVYDNLVDIDNRSDRYSISTLFPPKVGPQPATQYLFALADKDGSITLYFGPKAPKGMESNWIPTGGKRPFPVLRVYGGTAKFWDKSWKMPDVELVE
jgi:hypothetical protein